ncbi:hypothetical protein COU59_02975 [Candidatus Pacearchaeota archaeon CG10_big_fil_rev_8_21_14_0_10_34_12]|nr:MAG: hypothetical protein COU59_02975 [Candidatus Pacearchaeota archaeon CG10_big_fil_rev_8_21_14_0_10_34_12]
MAEEQFKRNIAYKLRISNVLNGKPIMNNERFGFLELEGVKIIRVNIIGIVVDRYESEGEKRYSFITLDDGSGQVKIKAFGDEVESVKDITHGQTVLVIGSLRYFNNEIYISPEIIKEHSPNYLLLRKLELEKENPFPSSNTEINQVQKQQKAEQKEKANKENSREKIVVLIKESESEGGIETEELIKKLSDSPEIVKQEIQKLLEEGIVFEPRPGKVRWLG